MICLSVFLVIYPTWDLLRFLDMYTDVFLQIWEICPYFFKCIYFLLPHSLFSPSEIPIVCAINYIVTEVTKALFIFLKYLSFHSADWAFIPDIVPSISRASIQIMFTVSIFFADLPICSLIRSILSFKCSSIFRIAVFKSLPAKSNLWVILRSVPLGHIFLPPHMFGKYFDCALGTVYDTL